MVDEIGAVVDCTLMERSAGFSSAGVASGDVIGVCHDCEQMLVTTEGRSRRPVGSGPAVVRRNLESQFDRGIVKSLLPLIPFRVSDGDNRFGVRGDGYRKAEGEENRAKRKR
jgi:hypothetical protein